MWATRIPIVAASLVWGVFSQPPQLREVYRTAFQTETISWLRLGVTFASLGVLSATLFFSALTHLTLWRSSSARTHSLLDARFGLLPHVIAAAPWFGVARGLHDAWRLSTGHAQEVSEVMTGRLETAGAWLLVVGVSVGLVGFRRRPPPISAAMALRRLLLGGACGLAVVLALFASPIRAPQSIGPIALVALCVSLVLGVATVMSVARARTGVPFLPLCLLAGAALAGLNVGSGHGVRILHGDAKENAERRVERVRQKAHVFSSDDIITGWLKNRRDLDAYLAKGRKYPVYVVAAQGGGIYAAYHAASFLAAMQDRCPMFADHVFAISSVSGGSVGAAVFAGLVSASPAANQWATRCEAMENGGALHGAAARVLKADLLSPLLASLFTTDLIQAFLPFDGPWPDRAARLEGALEAAWDAESPAAAGVMARDLFEMWDVAGPVPALMFNATSVDGGEQVVLSSAPVSFRGPHRDVGQFLERDASLRLSTAAFVSARFPWVTPAAVLPVRGKEGANQGVRLVDGGYFDNSGIEVALSIIRELRERPEYAELAGKIDVKLIVLSGRTAPAAGRASFAEALSPIRTVLAVRDRRTAIAQSAAASETCRMLINFEVYEFTSYRSCLDFENYDLPLGWLLSDESARTIDLLTALVGPCWPPRLYEEDVSRLERARMANVCTIMSIMRDLEH